MVPSAPGASSRDLTVAGERMSVVLQGSGPPLLLVHGFPSSWLSWVPVADRLAASHRVMAVDQVGFGRSTRQPTRPLDGNTYADRLADLLDALGLDRVDVAGLSWGGSVAQRLAFRHPGRVASLVLVASTSAAWAMRLGDRDLLGLALGRLVPSIATVAIRRYLASTAGAALPPAQLQALAAGYSDALQRPGTIAFLRRFVRAVRATPAIDLARITAPTLVIVPAGDRIVPPRVGHYLAQTIPRARLEVVQDAGHSIGFEQPTRLADLIRAFLADQRGRWPVARDTQAGGTSTPGR